MLIFSTSLHYKTCGMQTNSNLPRELSQDSWRVFLHTDVLTLQVNRVAGMCSYHGRIFQNVRIRVLRAVISRVRIRSTPLRVPCFNETI